VRRRLFNLAAAVSLAAWVWTLALWIGSYWAGVLLVRAHVHAVPGGGTDWQSTHFFFGRGSIEYVSATTSADHALKLNCATATPADFRGTTSRTQTLPTRVTIPRQTAMWLLVTAPSPAWIKMRFCRTVPAWALDETVSANRTLSPARVRPEPWEAPWTQLSLNTKVPLPSTGTTSPDGSIAKPAMSSACTTVAANRRLRSRRSKIISRSFLGGMPSHTV
jgi:hypothetical protein